MNSLNSLPLWAGLAALGVAVPILIHLWSRRQKIEIPWAAMELLRKALVARSQKIRMEDRLLLLLRCLTLLLVAAALLRPVFNTSGSAGSGGTGVVIAIDASYSMSHGKHARFEKALGKAREILSTLGEGDPVSVVLMSKHPQVLFRRTGYDPGAFGRALNESAAASAYPLNMERNLEQLHELVTELKTPTRECYIITDAQMTDWQGLSDQARNSLGRLSEESHVVLAPVSGSGMENLAITDLAYTAGSLQLDGSARFAAGIYNAGSQAVNGATVEFYADGKLKSRQDVGPLEAGESRPVSFYTSFDATGDVALSARLSKDDLPRDNQRHAIAGVRSSVSVLCIDGAVSEFRRTGTPARLDSDRRAGVPVLRNRGGYYAVRALRLKHAEVNAPIKVTHADAADSYREKLSDYDVVVMINVPDVPEDLAQRLQQFVEGGGGLLVFLGDKVDPQQYNQTLAGGAHSVLPARLIEKVEHEDPTKGWQIIPSKSDHPLAQVVGRLPADLTADARFHTAVRAAPLEGGQPILELGDGSLPLLLGSRDGRVLLFASSADRSWNNLPVHPLYAILLQQSATMLSRSADLNQGLVGEPATMPLPGRMMGDEVNVTDPLGTVEPVKVTVVEGSTAGVITPDRPGVYRLAAESGQEAAAVAANVDTAESNVRTADVATLRKWLENIPVEIVSEGVADAALNSRTGRDLGLLLLTLGASCFFAQGLLANHLSRRKHAGEAAGDVVTSLQGRRVAASRRN